MVIQMHNPDPDLAESGPNLDPDCASGSRSRFSKKKLKIFFFFNFYFSLCHYYENLTNLPLNKSEGPYTAKLVKLYITLLFSNF